MDNLLTKYQKEFWTNQKAIDEVIGRGISLSTADTFKLGYCSTHEYSPLNDRLIFPIHNQYGEHIAYQGRALFDYAELGVPKFWHNPGDWKRSVLYGLHENLERIYQLEYVVLCEGPFDVLALHECGIPAVAGLGIAFHQQQAFQLARYVKNWITWYDDDKAGHAGVESVKSQISKNKLGIHLTTLDTTGYKDPCDTLKYQGKRQVINNVRINQPTTIS